MKKRLKHIAIAAVVAVIVFLALPLLIYVPPIQNWMVQKATAIASEKTGLDISIEHVDLCFPLNLGVDGIIVKDNGDTIADIQRTVVDVGLLHLLKGDIEVDKLDINEARINTLGLIPDIQVKGTLRQLMLNPSKVALANSRVKLGDALLADADITVLLCDTAAIDTTETELLPWHIDMSELSIQRSQVDIHMSGDSMLIAIGGDMINAKGMHIALDEERYVIDHFSWKNGNLLFDMPFEPHQDTGLLDSLGIRSLCA